MMLNGNTNGYSLSDIAAVTDRRDDDFFGGGNGWWILFFFLFMIGGWGNNNGTNSTSYEFDIHDLDEGIRSLTSNVCSGFANTNGNMANGFYNTNTSMLTGFSDIAQAISNNTITGLQSTNALSSQLASHSADERLASCQTQNKVDSDFATLNYNLASQECDTRHMIQSAERDILDAGIANTRQILDFLVQDRISTLQTENAALRTQISQDAQNEYLISQLRPTVQPSYLVANPYTGTIYPTSAPMYTCGCGCSM